MELENWKEQVMNEINAKIQSEFFQLMKQINEDNQEIKTLKKGKLNSI